VARREEDAEQGQAAAEERGGRQARAKPTNAIASFLLSVGLILLVVAFLFVLWSPLKSLLTQFAEAMQQLLSITGQFR